MTVSLVLTVIGDDKPGLVDSLSGIIAEHGGNWLESRMAQLAGKFAGILCVDVAQTRADALMAALQTLEAKGLKVTVEKGAAGDSVVLFRTLNLELVGQDHPGIVHDISHALASRSISVEELSTETSSASMAGGTLFHANARLSVPETVRTEELRDLLESLANELMVDITLDDQATA